MAAILLSALRKVHTSDINFTSLPGQTLRFYFSNRSIGLREKLEERGLDRVSPKARSASGVYTCRWGFECKRLWVLKKSVIGMYSWQQSSLPSSFSSHLS
jgi:hypothetical protein